MRPDNRYKRKALGQLVRAKLVLVAVCRRCKHQHVIYPAVLIGYVDTAAPTCMRQAAEPPTAA